MLFIPPPLLCLLIGTAMYLSLLLMLIAWALWLGNSLAWLGVIVFILVMNGFQIAREEAYLESKFGDEYRRYKQKVRRWL